VAIAIGGSALTAVAALGVAYLTKKQESVAEWRKVLVEAAHDFSSGTGKATRAIREALRRFTEEPVFLAEVGEPEGPHEKAVHDAIWLVGEVSGQLDRVLLLFGQDSKAGQAAAETTDLLHKASEELRACLPEFDRAENTLAEENFHFRSARGACTSAENQHAEFNRMAWNSLPGRPHRFLGALRE
jgi:hypothetical protein